MATTKVLLGNESAEPARQEAPEKDLRQDASPQADPGAKCADAEAAGPDEHPELEAGGKAADEDAGKSDVEETGAAAENAENEMQHAADKAKALTSSRGEAAGPDEHPELEAG